MMAFGLSQRQQQILRATVNHYIVTAEPVGSKALAQGYELSISPATIRTVMGRLEKVGLLYQPHTSAGRVPSDSGYRIYVDELMPPSQALVVEMEKILAVRWPQSRSFEAMIRDASQLLSGLSGCVALITMPQTQTTTIRYLHLVPVEAQRVMLIVVTDTYQTESVLMELPQTPGMGRHAAEIDREDVEQELQILANFLNHQLQGRSLSDLATLDWQELDQQFQHYAQWVKALLVSLQQRTAPATNYPIVVGGLAKVLRQPEFSELQQAQSLIHLLEEESEQLWPLICGWSQSVDDAPQMPIPERNHRVTVRIGAENPLALMKSCTLVSSTYLKGTIPVGSVGILGPTRMAYDKVMALVETTAMYLSQTLNQPQLFDSDGLQMAK